MNDRGHSNVQFVNTVFREVHEVKKPFKCQMSWTIPITGHAQLIMMTVTRIETVFTMNVNNIGHLNDFFPS